MGMIGNSLAQGLVSGANIQDGTVDTVDLKDGGVTPAKLSTGHPLWDSVGQLTLPRNDTTNEGGQINFQRAVDASASWYIDLYGNNTTPTLRFVDGANVRMAIDGSGNVGIGVAPNAWGTNWSGRGILQLGDSGSYFHGGGTGWSGSSYIYIGNNGYYDGSAWKYTRNAATAQYTQEGSAHVFSNAAGGTAGSTISLVERARIDSSGNVGIGTNSPSTKLDIAGGTGNSRLQISVGTSEMTAFVVNNANNAFANSVWKAAYHSWYIGSTNVANIDSSGNLLVGQATGSYVISAAASANNGAKITNLTMGRSGSEYGSVGYGVRYTGTSNSYTYDVSDYASMIRFNGGNVETLTAQFGTAGNAISFTTGPYVARGGISWTNGSSDVRLKKNFEPSQGLSELLQVEPVKYHFNWEEDGAPKRLGFKAQNLLPVIPEMVSEKDELAEDGTPLLTITPDYMLPVLVKAIQEQQALIEAMQTRLAALEAK